MFSFFGCGCGFLCEQPNWTVAFLGLVVGLLCGLGVVWL
jgi:hypothetical protein